MTEEIKFVLQDAKWVADLSLALAKEEMIEDVLPVRGIGGLIGQSSSGKSFLALDAAAAIASGKADWFGKAVKKHKVVYVCLEGQAGFGRRIAAYLKHRDNPDLSGLKVITTPFMLLDATHRYELIETLVNRDHRNCLLIIDTLAQACPGIEENSSKDMGLIIAALNEIQQCLDAFVLIVHHQGKNEAQGARGHSSLKAAFDIEITVSRDQSNNRSFSITKSKDGEELPKQPFYLHSVDLGAIGGKQIESKVIAAATETATQRKYPSGKNQKIVYDIAGELLKEGRSLGMGNAPSFAPCIQQHELVEACKGRIPVSDPKRVTERVVEALRAMIADGIFEMSEGWLWLK